MNGLTGETINVSEKFDIEYVDLVKGLEVPTLTSMKYSSSVGYISITNEGYYEYSDNIDQISGWELYEKTENGYAKVYEGSDEISIEPFGNLYNNDIMAETITGIEVFKVENNNYIKLGDFRDKSEKMYYHLEDGESLTLAFRAYLESRKLYFSEYGFYVINNKING